MRKSGDYTADHVLKAEMMDSFLDNKDFQVQFIVDDRQRVVDMWRSRGFNVLQCEAWDEDGK